MSHLHQIKWPKTLSPTALVLTPLKQHLGCCVVVPALLKLLGGVALVQAFIRDPRIELLVLALALPPAVYAILKAEDAWRAHHARKHAAKHDPCDHHCAHHDVPFRRRFLINLIIAGGMAVLLHVLFHHHNG